MPFSLLKDKVVLITGASAGIGKETSRKFASYGSKLVLTARRLELLETLKADLEKEYSASVHIGKLDVTSLEEVNKFVSSLPNQFKNIDILVNNAGLALGFKTTYEATEEEINSMIDTNVKGVAWLIKAVVPGMVERNSGHIINVSSIAAYESYKCGSYYCGSKHAVRSMTTSLRKELVHTPIRVSLISPGLVSTDFSKVRFNNNLEIADKVYQGLPLGPLFAEDIAEDILYVASRNPHVQVADIITFPTNQASTEHIFRE